MTHSGPRPGTGADGGEPAIARADLADSLLLELASPDRSAAARFCVERLHEGMTFAEIVDLALAPAMAQVGSFWEHGVWTPGDEHRAVAAADAALTAVAAEHDPVIGGGTIVVACAEGDWHSLPTRMVAEVLAVSGWSVRFLGASQTVPMLVEHLRRHRPDAVLLGCAVPAALPSLMHAVAAVHRLHLPVLVGGGAVGARVAALGADASASSASGVVEVLSRRLRARPDHGRDGDRLDVVRRRRALAPRWIGAATSRIALRTEDTGSDYLAHLLDMGAVSLMLDDPELMTAEVAWLRRVLLAHGLGGDAVEDAVAALQDTAPRDPLAWGVVELLGRSLYG